MRFNNKLIKKIGVSILGLAAIGAATFGIVKLAQVAKEENRTIHLNYEVGGLNDATGKYEKVTNKIYTKDKFACYGLNTTLKFDSEIKYQIFYYDVLDNFISSTEDLSIGFSEEAPLNGAYARIEITPTNDEDGKISFIEKFNYAGQLKVEVSKTATSKLKERYTTYKGKCLQVVDNPANLNFELGTSLNDSYEWANLGNKTAGSSKTLLAINENNKIEINTSKITLGSQTLTYNIYFFDGLPTTGKLFNVTDVKTSDSDLTFKIDKKAKYVLIDVTSTADMEQSFADTLGNAIVLSEETVVAKE